MVSATSGSLIATVETVLIGGFPSLGVAHRVRTYCCSSSAPILRSANAPTLQPSIGIPFPTQRRLLPRNNLINYEKE